MTINRKQLKEELLKVFELPPEKQHNYLKTKGWTKIENTQFMYTSKDGRLCCGIASALRLQTLRDMDEIIKRNKDLLPKHNRD